MRRPALFAAVFVMSMLTALAGAGRGAAASLCVGAKAPCLASLQAAVDAAQDGDVIHVGPGTFAGGVVIGKSVDVIGSRASATMISGGGPVLTIGERDAAAEPTVTIAGVTVTGGVNTSSPVAFFAEAGGIDVPSSADGGPGATVTIRDSVIAGNGATPSGIFPSPSGVLCAGGTFCPFAQGEGGGIYNTGAMILDHVVVSGNEAGGSLASDADAGGISNLPGASLTIRHSVISDNVARAPAPNGRFAEGGGIFSRHDSTLVIVDSVVNGNRADLVVAQDVLDGDTLAQAAGIRVGPSATATIRGTTISGNGVSSLSLFGDSNAFSGGVHADGSLVLRDSVVSGNSVRSAVPAGSHASANADSGVGELNDTATISDSRLVGNTVTASAPDGTARAFAGAMLTAAFERLTVRDSVVSGNRLSASTLTGSARVQGAGIANMGVLTLRDTDVRDNAGAASGPGGVAEGGGIWNGVVFPDGPPSIALTLVDSTVTGNTLAASAGLPVRGGGVFTAFPLVLRDSSIAGNAPDQCFGC